MSEGENEDLEVMVDDNDQQENDSVENESVENDQDENTDDQIQDQSEATEYPEMAADEPSDRIQRTQIRITRPSSQVLTMTF